MFFKKSSKDKPFLVRTIFFTYQNFLKCHQTSKMPSRGFGSLQCFVRQQNPLFLDSYMYPFAPCKGIWIPESGKILLAESWIIGFGIRNTTQGIRNPTTNDWNPESKFHRKRQESGTRNPESTAWNPESKTVLDSLTCGQSFIGSSYCTLWAWPIY